MSKIEITEDLAKEYYATQKTHSNYQECVVRYFQTSFHFDGYYMKPMVGNAKVGGNTLYDRNELTNPFFVWLIDKVRPGESAVIKNYRRNIYLPKTKNPVHKVYNVLRKILKSPDWSINFPKEHVKDGKTKKSSPIKEEISLENYITKVFPFFDSMENWFFQTGLRSMLLDANAMIVVMPLEFPNEENKGDLINPFPYIIYSKDVYEYKEDKLCVFKSPNVHTWFDKNGNKKQSAVLLIANENEMYEAYKEDDDDKIILNIVWEHNMGHMPIWPIGGEVTTFNGNSTVYDSFLEPMMPDLNDMVRRFSDHQAEIVQHIYSTMWYVAQQKCNNCSGSGMVLQKGKQNVCPQCGGDGALNNTPFGSFKIKAPDKSKLENYQMITPPAGYINKPIDMVKLQEDMIKELCRASLSSVNLEFLVDEPLVQSGKAKAYDQEAGNAYIHKVAFHIVSHIFEPIIFFINRIRYFPLVQNEAKLDAMLPTLAVPDTFDLETSQMLEDKLVNLQKANVDSEIVSQVKREYIAKKFQDSPDVLKRFDLKEDHNPFPNRDLKDVIDMETAGLIEKADAIKYVYIDDFICTLEQEHDNLFDLEYDEVEELLNELAQEKLELLSASSQVESLSQIPDEYNLVDETDEEGNKTGRKVPRSNTSLVPLKIANRKSGKAGKKTTGLRNA